MVGIAVAVVRSRGKETFEAEAMPVQNNPINPAADVSTVRDYDEIDENEVGYELPVYASGVEAAEATYGLDTVYNGSKQTRVVGNPTYAGANKIVYATYAGPRATDAALQPQEDDGMYEMPDPRGAIIPGDYEYSAAVADAVSAASRLQARQVQQPNDGYIEPTVCVETNGGHSGTIFNKGDNADGFYEEPTADAIVDAGYVDLNGSQSFAVDKEPVDLWGSIEMHPHSGSSFRIKSVRRSNPLALLTGRSVIYQSSDTDAVYVEDSFYGAAEPSFGADAGVSVGGMMLRSASDKAVHFNSAGGASRSISSTVVECVHAPTVGGVALRSESQEIGSVGLGTFVYATDDGNDEAIAEAESLADQAAGTRAMLASNTTANDIADNEFNAVADAVAGAVAVPRNDTMHDYSDLFNTLMVSENSLRSLSQL